MATTLVAACTGTTDHAGAPSAQPRAARSGCGSPIDGGPLPEWARDGFSGDTSMPHVMGDGAAIVAALFGDPLTANRTDGKANKILWVAKDGSAGPGDLVIDATLDGPGETARRTVPGGPGPSIVDLPRAGCWRLRLTWPGHADTMDLTYG
ncbi:hypothetical protein [Dactylosporangium sp. CA-139066]|uniref:hypothetical protein n=1 Tax=Dactylosporangium sp. CA-139066 TaxID=3239930 RepID=UPI003D89FF1E